MSGPIFMKSGWGGLYLKGTGEGTQADPFIISTGNGVSNSVLKTATVTGTTASTSVWIPADGLHLDIRSIHFTFQTGTNEDDAVALLEYYKDGSWETLMRLGAKKDRFTSGHHAFVGHVDSDDGDGTNPRIRIVVTGTDSDMVASATVEGNEE